VPDKNSTACLKQLAGRRLSTLEAAEVLRILCNVPSAHMLCQELARTLQNTVSPEWISDGDLAKVFAVLDALHGQNPAVLGGREMAAIATRLLASETAVGGPYASQNGEVDLRANAYIANCMTWLAASLPQIEQFLAQALAAGQPTLQDLVIVSRAYPRLAKTALQRSAQSDVDTAAATYYIAQQIGEVHQAALPNRPAVTAQTDTLILALTLFANHDRSQPAVIKLGHDNQLGQVIQLAKASYDTLPEPLRGGALTVFNRLLRVDSEHEITLLPHFFARAYTSAAPVSTALLNQLGAANIHTWLAYTIYDDFLDDEGQPPLLPVANVALRAAATAYRQVLPGHDSFQKYVSTAFIAVDAANSWEIEYWRYDATKHSITIGGVPRFNNRQLLADRALLHIVGPLAVLAADGKTPLDAVWQHTAKALRHYLIARQLTDDLHDWVKDLRAGHVSYIVAEVLRSLAPPRGVYAFDQLLPAAREQFWQRLLPELCQTIIAHAQQAKKGLQPYMQTADNQLFSFLDKLEETMQAALNERKQSQDFLRLLS
jgi:hypothetical protein